MPTSLSSPAVRAALTPNAAFPSPTDWRDVWIYFLLVDRFNNPQAPPRNPPYDRETTDYQGGTLEGVRARLPYLKDLGAGALWLSPVLRNPQSFAPFWGGYAIQNFLEVDPRVCSNPAAARANAQLGDQELRALVDEAHQRGMYVIMDIVLNHTGDLFAYSGGASEAPWRADPPYGINWRNETGAPNPAWPGIAQVPNNLADAGVWPEELRRDDYFRRRGNESGAPRFAGDFGGGLKELVTEYLIPGTGVFPVRDVLIRCYQYLIGKFDIDGYRIDTLQYVEPEFARVFGNAMREYAQSIGKKNFFTFGEVWQDSDEAIVDFIGRDTRMDGELVGVDAALDFPVQRRLREVCKGFAPPVSLAGYFDVRRSVQRSIVSSHGEASRYFVTFLDNHDLDDRFYFRDAAGAYDDQHALAVACLFGLQGIPCLYYGAEQGLSGRGDRREAVREALWGAPNPFDTGHKFFRAVKALTALRAAEPALRFGRQYFRPLSGDGISFGHSPFAGGVVAFSRILNDREVTVVANTSTTSGSTVFVELDRQLNPDGRPLQILYCNQATPEPPRPVTTRAQRATTQVRLRKMEVQIIA
jgi:glycosidase